MGIANCGHNSDCLNTIGSFVCSCNRGFHRNVSSYGCQPAVGMCPDGTFCDKNAVCKHAKGLRVRIFCNEFLFNFWKND